MRMSLLAIAATAGIGFGVTAAKAELLVPLVTDSAAPAVTFVAQGCGMGYSRGASGRCRPSAFGFGVPGGRRYGYGGGYGYDRRDGYGYGRRDDSYGYGRRDDGYGGDRF